ncbi:hypothetical protein [Roseobacter sp. MH60115]|uniref:hypothetical protein n=1 Tax=Roseobacter sp. MH60115 TaxID=2785324 RepID=UPI0018A32ED0|nr:hypothetical protein [Roseobacter sp. MH60115]
MKHETISESKMSRNVMGLDDGEIAPFVRKCVKERSLSRVVTSLNNDLLFGTQTERDDARIALQRIGFSDI